MCVPNQVRSTPARRVCVIQVVYGLHLYKQVCQYSCTRMNEIAATVEIENNCKRPKVCRVRCQATLQAVRDSDTTDNDYLVAFQGVKYNAERVSRVLNSNRLQATAACATDGCSGINWYTTNITHSIKAAVVAGKILPDLDSHQSNQILTAFLVPRQANYIRQCPTHVTSLESRILLITEIASVIRAVPVLP